MPTATLKRQPATDANAQLPKIFIATPAYGGQFFMEHVHGLGLLFRSLEASGIKYVWCPLANESLITRARNRCVAEFLKTDCTDLLFLDADVGFKPKDVAAMVRSKFEVVCGAYPMKSYSWEAVANEVRAGMPSHLLAEIGAHYAVNMPDDAQRSGKCDVIEDGGCKFVEVLDAATGFLLIRRRIIERFIQAYGDEIRYIADYKPNMGETHYAVFQDTIDPTCPAETAKAALIKSALSGDAAAVAKAADALRTVDTTQLGRWLSEDYWFSRKCQQMGVKIYLCLDAQLSHTGMHTWQGDVAKLFEVTEDAPKAASGSDVPADAA